MRVQGSGVPREHISPQIGYLEPVPGLAVALVCAHGNYTLSRIFGSVITFITEFFCTSNSSHLNCKML